MSCFDSSVTWKHSNLKTWWGHDGLEKCLLQILRKIFSGKKRLQRWKKRILVRTAYCLVEAHLSSTEKKNSPAEGRKIWFDPNFFQNSQNLSLGPNTKSRQELYCDWINLLSVRIRRANRLFFLQPVRKAQGLLWVKGQHHKRIPSSDTLPGPVRCRLQRKAFTDISSVLPIRKVLQLWQNSQYSSVHDHLFGSCECSSRVQVVKRCLLLVSFYCTTGHLFFLSQANLLPSLRKLIIGLTLMHVHHVPLEVFARFQN